jgi:hypothetical protein
MYVERVKNKQANRIYEQILLRESFREPGAPRGRVKHRTLLNLTHCPPADVRAIELALKHKNNIELLQQLTKAPLRSQQERSVGAVWLLWRLAQRIGLVDALGRSQPARRILWQIFARLIDQGSRLSAVRLAREHAACEVLGLDDFDEDSLYQDMDWLDARQHCIEDRLYRRQYKNAPPQLFLYDVTSTYFEGKQNAYGEYGYNRDGKRGKLQMVVGLLTDVEGVPISVEVFHGNTQDLVTVYSQIRKLADRFGVREVTLVGDRGMLKSAQIEALNDESFHYLTAITKPQIRVLLREGILQLGLFDEKVCEVWTDGVRYILRRNPLRAEEIAEVRADKFRSLCKRIEKRNQYLQSHARAQVEGALRKIERDAKELRIEDWVRIYAEGRRIVAEVDQSALDRIGQLDGCYVLKSDVRQGAATAEQLHARYKDLSQVEQAFRSMKMAHLQIRPVYVRTAAHTRAHVFIVMLAYGLRRELDAAWREMDLTAEGGLGCLSSLCAEELTIGEKSGYLSVPTPRATVAELFAACAVEPPTALPRRRAKAATKRKLPPRRKTR